MILNKTFRHIYVIKQFLKSKGMRNTNCWIFQFLGWVMTLAAFIILIRYFKCKNKKEKGQKRTKDDTVS